MSNKENRAKDGSNRNGNGNGNNNGNSYSLKEVIQGNFNHYPEIISTRPITGENPNKRISFWDILFGKV